MDMIRPTELRSPAACGTAPFKVSCFAFIHVIITLTAQGVLYASASADLRMRGILPVRNTIVIRSDGITVFL